MELTFTMDSRSYRSGISLDLNALGVFYTEYLKQIHQVRKPASYLEIGVETGATLAFAECRTIAIDPLFQFRGDPFGRRRETYLFQMTSDEFFARHDLRTFFPDGLDFAFLDGMHHFEFLLRDFLNTEKFSHRDTIVGLHDCYPINTEMANRETNYDRRADMATRRMWTGDVWKLLPILRDFRPDLEVIALDCPPTGLIIVRNCVQLAYCLPTAIKRYLRPPEAAASRYRTGQV